MLALASQGCALCFGLGRSFTVAPRPCPCVLRNVWSACWERFRVIAGTCPRLATQEPGSGGMWSIKDAEYMADFIAVAKRALGADSLGFQIFRYHYLLGANWRLCCRKLNMDRGAFWHEVYRVQRKVGRALRETRPFPLFPLCEYFAPRKRDAHRVVPTIAAGAS